MPGGLVILGQGESLIGLTNQLEPSRDFRGTWVASDGTPKNGHLGSLSRPALHLWSSCRYMRASTLAAPGLEPGGSER
jgi:hypothetical protein